MAWTEQQEAAITTRDCGLIVSAAAGSGKTSVLVERLLRILMEEDPEKRVPADRMIVVTFTNDAAAEMKTRLYQALDLQIEQHPENKCCINSRFCCKVRIFRPLVLFALILFEIILATTASLLDFAS